MNHLAVVNSHGRSIGLGKEIGAGGEGVVHEIAGDPTVVAKIYKQRLSADKLAKLAAMLRVATSDLTAIAAWPKDVLREAVDGPVVGVLLPRVEHALEIHELYSPAHRRTNFPHADWRHLIHASRNLCAAFELLHGKGVVVGDVNQGNIFVDNRMTVRFIDCDSFQLSMDGVCFRCEVGVPHFTPPELQGISLRTVERNFNHDAFGLAVLVFHLLFMGRHPFAGRYHGSGEMPIERAIKEHRFAYSSDMEVTQMSPPPTSIPLSAVSAGVRQLFERAFAQEGRDVLRPSALEWVHELERLLGQLTPCRQDPGHWYLQSNSVCPWCQVVSSGGPNFFVSVAISIAAPEKHRIDVSVVWARIESISRPQGMLLPSAPPFAPVRGAVVPDILEEEELPARLVQWLAFGFGALCLLGTIFPSVLFLLAPLSFVFGGWRLFAILNSPLKRLERQRAGVLLSCETDLKRVKAALGAELQKQGSRFDFEFSRLALLREEYQSLDGRKAAELLALERDAERRQFTEFLGGHFISKNLKAIPHIGPSRLATLESYGIETALDITSEAVLAIDGFGPAIADSLVAWRDTVASQFRFDAQKKLPEQDVQSIEVKYYQRRKEIEDSLIQGCEQLESVSQKAQVRIQSWTPQFAQLIARVEQAKADFVVCRDHPSNTNEHRWVVAIAIIFPIAIAAIASLLG